MNPEQDEFMDSHGLPYKDEHTICTFGLCEKANVLEHLPIDIYKTNILIGDLIEGRAFNTIYRIQNKSLMATLEAKRRLAAEHPVNRMKQSPLSELMSQMQKTPYNPSIDPFVFYRRIMENDQPLAALERQFMLFFIGEFAGKYSMDTAAKKLGLSGGEKFKRILKKYNLKYITVAEMKMALRFIKQKD
jgi:hypothetical protein